MMDLSSHDRIRKAATRDSLDYSEVDSLPDDYLNREREKILSLNTEDSVPGHGEEFCTTTVYRRPVLGYRPHFTRRQNSGVESGGKGPRRSFCRSWCEMWFLLARSKITCIGLSLVLFGGGLLLILLTTLGGLMQCPTLNGAVVFCLLMSTLSFSLGLLCCFYHLVKDEEDLPFAIFCMAYCLLFLFMIITISGTVVVFTRIHPIGPDQPPPGVPLPNIASLQNLLTAGSERNVTVLAAGAKDCGLVELPLGVLVICYFLSIGFVVMSYVACILALGATSDIPPL